MLAGVLLLALVAQLALTLLRHPDLESPNACTLIARTLLATGTYSGGDSVWLYGTGAPQRTLRMFNLPAEPLLEAAGLHFLSARWQPLFHIPITLLLIGAVAFWGWELGGEALGWAAGLVAAFDPFILMHGAVWDDTFTAAAFTWLFLALLWRSLPRARAATPAMSAPAVTVDTASAAAVARAASTGVSKTALRLVAFGLLAALLALLRAEQQAILLSLAAGIFLFPRLRPLRRPALATVLGIAMALSLWGLRNRHVSGHFFTGSSLDGISLWESVYPHAGQAILERGQTERFGDYFMHQDYRHTQGLDEVGANRVLMHLFWIYTLHHPLAIARLGLLKIGVDLLGLDFTPGVTPWRNRVSAAANLALLLLALIGFIAAGRGRGVRPLTAAERQLLWLIVGSVLLWTIAGLVAGPVGMRFRVSADPLLWLAAGLGLLALLPRTWQRRRARPDIA